MNLIHDVYNYFGKRQNISTFFIHEILYVVKFKLRF